MFCRYCGTKLADNLFFCTNCGRKIRTEKESETNTTDCNHKESKDELIRAICSFQSGDQSSFEIVYNLTNRYVYYSILKSVKDKEIANDVLQDTYLEIFRNLSALRSSEAFRGWAGKIAQHKIALYFKKNPVNYADEDSDRELVNLAEKDEDLLPEDSLDNRETQRLISNIIDELPLKQRTAIVAFYYNQMTIPEIADAMEVPENTVKTWLSRGKGKIKDAVLDLEKKHGTKLYTIGIGTVLFFVFDEETSACELPACSLQFLQTIKPNVIYSGESAIKAASATGKAVHVAGGVAKWKIIAAIAAAVVIGGAGVGVALQAYKNNDRIDQVYEAENTEKVSEADVDSDADFSPVESQEEYDNTIEETDDFSADTVIAPEEDASEKKEIMDTADMVFPTEEKITGVLHYFWYWTGLQFGDGETKEIEGLSIQQALPMAAEYVLETHPNGTYPYEKGEFYRVIPTEDVRNAMEDLFGQEFDISQYIHDTGSVGVSIEGEKVLYGEGDFGEVQPEYEIADIAYHDDGTFTVVVRNYIYSFFENREIPNSDYFLLYDCAVAADKPEGFIITDMHTDMSYNQK